MTEAGRIFQINLSAGGVPKTAVPTAEVSSLGVVGDVQRDKKHHGGPERALCLYSLDRILALQAEGHPIYPGSIGENITISGLDWSEIGPGVRLQLGEVAVEVTGYAVPCRNIRHSFDQEYFNRVSAKKFPGWSRAYVRILQTGHIQVGDKVTVEAVLTK